MRLVYVVLATFYFISVLEATTYQIGPTRNYTSLQDVAPLLQPGDVVEVDGNHTYPGGVVFSTAGTAASKITIRGIRVNGKRPIISGGANTVQFRTDWPFSGPGGDHYIFEGFEITGGTSRGIYHQADDLTVRDCVVHDCPAHGILGADQGSGSLTMEYVEVYRCGEGSTRHQIYMATDEVHYPGSVFRMRHCYVHDGNGGNNVKSRAERSEIYYNWIEGAYYHEIELIGPDGGDDGNPALKREDSDVVGNVFYKTSDFYVTRLGGDGTGETNGRYRFVNNTFICSSRAVYRLFDGIESLATYNNVFYRANGSGVRILDTSNVDWTSGSEQIAGSNNWIVNGSTDVPSQWTATLIGSDPGFSDFNSDDVSPNALSILVNAGTASITSPLGYTFPNPLFPPAMHPPSRQIEALNSAVSRPVDSTIDIGGFEWRTTTVNKASILLLLLP